MLNFNGKNKVFVTSDTHLHHNRDFVWKSRGYASVKEHDDSVINKINAIVEKDDILIHLGDFCLNTIMIQFEETISRINCQNIYMLFGNHPNPHYKNVYLPCIKTYLGGLYEEGMELYPIRYKNIIYIGHYAEVTVDNQFICLCHYPISIWNHMSHGSWCLVGHSHYSFPQTQVDSTYGKILDVGWDGHAKPLSINDIRTIMDKKQIVAVDHHE